MLDRLANHPATASARASAERESLRLLYVGWTRARDRLVIAMPYGELCDSSLRLLCNSAGHPLIYETDGYAGLQPVRWGKRQLEVLVRQAEPTGLIVVEPRPAPELRQDGPRSHPPAFVQPSSLLSVCHDALQTIRIGPRIALSGKPDWANLGEAVHGFLCVDRENLTDAERSDLLEKLLQRWQVASHVKVTELLQACERFRQWVHQRWPAARWNREWPLLYRDGTGSIFRGATDLVLRDPTGLVVIDHKSFPGDDQQCLLRAAEHVGQLRMYRQMLAACDEHATVTSTWLHLPIAGVAIEIPA